MEVLGRCSLTGLNPWGWRSNPPIKKNRQDVEPALKQD
jgi:hypothetical protein